MRLSWGLGGFWAKGLETGLDNFVDFAAAEEYYDWLGVIAILSAAKGSIWAKYQKFMALDSNDVINKTQ